MTLNDYYMVYDAAHEDHEVELVQLKKAKKEYNLEEEDSMIKSLKEFKAALLTQFEIHASGDTPDFELTAEQKGSVKKILDKTICKVPQKNKGDVLCFADFLNLTGNIVILASKFFLETSYMRKMERREFLTAKDFVNYSKSVQAYQKKLKQYRTLVANAVT